MGNAIKELEELYPELSAEFKAIQQNQYELFAKKHLDYGPNNISAGTNLETDDEVEFAMTGLWYRMSDKINRWKNMIITNRKPENETLIDTFQDLSNYAIIAQIVSKGKWK
jgi:hypothetical protein